MQLSFEDRVAVVTGAGSGLGRAHAMLLASRGAAVVVNDLADPGPVVSEIVEAGGEAVGDTNTVATVEGGEGIIATAMKKYGRVDIVVNNAGIVRDKTFGKMTPDLIDPVFDVHLKGAFYVTRPAYMHMREQGYGRIVSTSSAAGLFGNFGQTNYGAAKAGIIGLTRVLALEGFKYGVQSNVLAPIAATQMSAGLLDEDWERRLRPELVAPAVAWLAHEDCDANGEIIACAAGRVARIFIGETVGFYSPDLTLEAIRDNWDAIRDEEGYSVPIGAEGERDLFSAAFARAEGVA
jgi:NAD(P)-dependent dehydrogenase (short-subunit alcohol dehydrogenase family)